MNVFRDAALVAFDLLPQGAPDWLVGFAVLTGITLVLFAMFAIAGAIAWIKEKNDEKERITREIETRHRDMSIPPHWTDRIIEKNRRRARDAHHQEPIKSPASNVARMDGKALNARMADDFQQCGVCRVTFASPIKRQICSHCRDEISAGTPQKQSMQAHG